MSDKEIGDKVTVGMGVREEDVAPLVEKWKGIQEYMTMLQLNAEVKGPFPKDITVAVRMYPNRAGKWEGPEEFERLRVVKGRAISAHFAAVAHEELLPALDGSNLFELVHLPSGRGGIFVDMPRWKIETMCKLAEKLERAQDWRVVRCASPVVCTESAQVLFDHKPALPGIKDHRARRGEAAPMSDSGCGYSIGGMAIGKDKERLCPNCGMDHGKALYDGLEGGGMGGILETLERMVKEGAGVVTVDKSGKSGGLAEVPDHIFAGLMSAFFKEMARRMKDDEEGGKKGKGGRSKKRDVPDDEEGEGEE